MFIEKCKNYIRVVSTLGYYVSIMKQLVSILGHQSGNN